MKSMLRHVIDHGVEYDCLAFVCPGCALIFGDGLHMLPVNSDIHSPAWDWDGNLEAPTVSPSILTEAKHRTVPFVCHSFLKAGVFDFLTDSTHALSGKQVVIPDLPDWFITESEIVMSPEEVTETETITETITETTEVPDPAQTDQPAPDAQPAQTDQPAPDAQPAQTDQPAPDAQPAQTDQPAPDAQPAQTDQPAPDAPAAPDAPRSSVPDQSAPTNTTAQGLPTAGQTPA